MDKELRRRCGCGNFFSGPVSDAFGMHVLNGQRKLQDEMRHLSLRELSACLDKIFQVIVAQLHHQPDVSVLLIIWLVHSAVELDNVVVVKLAQDALLPKLEAEEAQRSAYNDHSFVTLHCTSLQ